MAFPTITAQGSVSGVATTSKSVTVPSGVVSGDLLIMMVRHASGGSINDVAGWTTMLNLDIAGNNNCKFFKRIADGTEGSSVTVTLTTARRSVHVMFRITGHDGIGNVEIEGDVATTPSPIDPPSLTASWGSKDTLWITTAAMASPRTFSAYPTGYTGLHNNDTGNTAGNSAHAGSASAYLLSTNATEDPPVFTYSLSNNSTWTNATIAVKPLEAAQNTGNFLAFM